MIFNYSFPELFMFIKYIYCIYLLISQLKGDRKVQRLYSPLLSAWSFYLREYREGSSQTPPSSPFLLALHNTVEYYCCSPHHRTIYLIIKMFF